MFGYAHLHYMPQAVEFGAWMPFELHSALLQMYTDIFLVDPKGPPFNTPQMPPQKADEFSRSRIDRAVVACVQLF